MTKLNRNKKFIKLIYLAAIVPLFALGGLVNNKNIKPVYASVSDQATYGTNCQSGYYNYSNAKSDTGIAFPTLQKFTTDYGVFYVGDDEDLDGVINYEITGDKTIKIKAPFILPYVDDVATSKWGFFRFVQTQLFNEDVWDNVKTIKTDGNGQLNTTSISIKGTEYGGSGISDVSFSLNPIMETSGHKAIQNLTITLNKNINDYEYLKIDLGDISYTSVAGSEIEYDERMLVLYKNDNPLNYIIELNPSSQTKIVEGTKINENMPNSPIWYETASTTGHPYSFENEHNAYTYVYNSLKNDVNNHKLISKTYNSTVPGFNFPSPINYVDIFGSSISSSSAKVVDSSQFTHGSNYDIVLLPKYKTNFFDSNLKLEIESLYAFKQTDMEGIGTFLETEALKFVKQRDVFTNKYPANAYEGENTVFKDYEFYKDLSLKSHETITYNSASYGADYFASHAITGQTPYTPENHEFITYPDSVIGGQIKSYKNVFNVKEPEGYEWGGFYTYPFGTDAFKNIWASLLSGADEIAQYTTKASETENKVEFISSDALFVSISKDEGNPTYLVSETTYNISPTNYATIKNQDFKYYNFSEKGIYNIKLYNRGTDKVVNKTLVVYDESDITVTNNTATNKKLELKINKPSGSIFDSLKIYKSTDTTGHLDQQFYSETLSTPLTNQQLTDGGFIQLSFDDDGHEIKSSTTLYTFNEDSASLTNPFAYTFYIQATLLNETKYFKAYWNYRPAQADTINININNWEANVGYSTTYTVTVTSSTGEDVDPSTKGYNVIIDDPTIVSIDKASAKITGLKAGTTNVKFELANGLGYQNKTIIITDKEDLRKEIRVPSETLNLNVNEQVSFVAIANPTKLFDQQFTYSFSTPGIAKYENGKVVGLCAGTTNMIISHASPELADKVVTITVEALPSTYTLTSNCGEHGTFTGNKVTYQANETANVTIKADQGYEIESITFNDETISITNNSEMLVSKVINKDSVLTATFKERTSPIPTTYNLTVNNGEGGTVTGNKATYNDGETMTVVVTANENYEIDTITFNNETVEVTNNETMTVTKTINSDSSLTITYKAKSTPTPDPTPGDSKTPVIIGVACGVGAVIIGLLTFLIIKAKKSGSMKK